MYNTSMTMGVFKGYTIKFDAVYQTYSINTKTFSINTSTFEELLKLITTM